jgi:hypothetical protein
MGLKKAIANFFGWVLVAVVCFVTYQLFGFIFLVFVGGVLVFVVLDKVVR